MHDNRVLTFIRDASSCTSTVSWYKYGILHSDWNNLSLTFFIKTRTQKFEPTFYECVTFVPILPSSSIFAILRGYTELTVVNNNKVWTHERERERERAARRYLTKYTLYSTWLYWQWRVFCAAVNCVINGSISSHDWSLDTWNSTV